MDAKECKQGGRVSLSRDNPICSADLHPLSHTRLLCARAIRYKHLFASKCGRSRGGESTPSKLINIESPPARESALKNPSEPRRTKQGTGIFTYGETCV